MADTFKGIITADGKERQLPYNAVLEPPISDETLSIQGGFADAKVVGNNFKKVKAETASLKEEKVDYLVNIARSDNIFSEGNLGATNITKPDGSITVTPTASYGRYDYRFNVLPTGAEKTFYFSAYAETEADCRYIQSH